MWSFVVVVFLPDLQFLTRIVQCDKLIDIEEFVPQLSVEQLDQSIIRGLSGTGVVEFDPSPIRPFVQRFRGELRPVVHGDCFGSTAVPGNLIQCLCHAPA